MLHIYQGGRTAHSSVVLSPADFHAREQRETRSFPDVTVKITLAGREFTILDHGQRSTQ